jgi:hypothetical protein
MSGVGVAAAAVRKVRGRAARAGDKAASWAGLRRVGCVRAGRAHRGKGEKGK